MNKINHFSTWLREKFTGYFLHSFKSTLLSLYIPIIIVFITITGMASYILAARQIEENTYRNVRETVFQTGNYLDNRLADVFEQLVALANHSDILAVIAKDQNAITPEDYIHVRQHIERITMFYSVIDSIFVNLHDGMFFLYQSDTPSTNVKFSFAEYRYRYEGNPNDIYWRNVHTDEFSTRDASNRVVSVFKLVGKENAESRGIIMFNIRYDFFEKILSKSALSKNGYFILVNQEGSMVFKPVADKYQLDGDIIEQLQETKRKEGRFEFQKPQGENLVVIYDTLPTNQWKLAAVFPKDEILERVNFIKYITLFIIVIVIFIAVFLANMLASYVAKPISALTDSMKRVQAENIDFISRKHPLNEMGVLNQGVKDLVERVKVLLEQTKADEETKRQLEFAVIQTQIHPHFLYNTLYSIKGLCDMGMNEDASAMITALSNFFRISISRGEEIISVEEEISHIKNYLFIQEMRYGDDFSYEICVEPRLLSYTIVKLTLQPLVENAIYHGVKQKRGSGWIRVNGYQVGRSMYFEVKDNGLGMDEERLAQVRNSLVKSKGKEKLGLGVRSVYQRLQIHYGSEADLTIESELEKGTTVTVIIPILEGEAHA